jgi:hypothetical protein
MNRPDLVATCETAKCVVGALLMATSEEVHEKLTRLDKGQPGSVLRALRLTRDRLTGERGSEIMLKGPTAKRLTERVNELVGNVGLVGARVFDLSEEDREHANRAPIALSIPLHDELVRASSTLDRLLGRAVELRNWREVKEAELASLVETSDPAANAIRHQRRAEIAGEITLVSQQETGLLGDVYEVSNAIRQSLEERTQLLSNLIRLGLGPIPSPRITRGPYPESPVPLLDQGLIRKIIDILSQPNPPFVLPDEVTRFIESVFETIDWQELLKGLLPVGPFLPIPKFIWDYYSGLLSPKDLDEARDHLAIFGSLVLNVPDLARQLLFIGRSRWPFTSPFLQPRIDKSVSKLGSVVFAGSDALSAVKSEWNRQQGLKDLTNYSDTQISVHSTLDAAAEGIVTVAVIEGGGAALLGVPIVGGFLSVGYKAFVGPPVADFVNKNFTAPIMDKKYVEDGIDKGYEIARAVLGKTVYGAGEMVSIGGDTISRVGETASSVGEKIEDAGKKLQAWSGRLFE